MSMVITMMVTMDTGIITTITTTTIVITTMITVIITAMVTITNMTSAEYRLARCGRRGFGLLPLPLGERAGVRAGVRGLPTERLNPLTPPLSLWEREQTEPAS